MMVMMGMVVGVLVVVVVVVAVEVVGERFSSQLCEGCVHFPHGCLHHVVKGRGERISVGGKVSQWRVW